MGRKSSIEWTNATWNPIRGCSMATGSETGGCLNCYAARMNARNLPNLKSPTTGKPFARLLDSGPRWTGAVEVIEKALDLPSKWREPRMIFVNSQSDLFHENLPFEQVDRIFAVMAFCWWHKFQVLTKRAERMLEYFTSRDSHLQMTRQFVNFRHYETPVGPWPLPNVWLGVSAENQETANARIPYLLMTPAAIRFISAEPLLGTINLKRIEHEPKQSCGGTCFINALDGTSVSLGGEQCIPALNWVIAGGESGPKARFCSPVWVRSLRDQCANSQAAFFFKQWGAFLPDNQNPQMSGPSEDWQGIKVGKHAAGAFLDGVEYKAFPSEPTEHQAKESSMVRVEREA